MTLRIYIEQYGYFYSFSPKKFMIMASRYIKTGKSFDYKNYGVALSRPPYKYVYRSGNRWSASSSGTFLFHALDWDKGDYQQAYREVYTAYRKEQAKKAVK